MQCKEATSSERAVHRRTVSEQRRQLTEAMRPEALAVRPRHGGDGRLARCGFLVQKPQYVVLLLLPPTPFMINLVTKN